MVKCDLWWPRMTRNKQPPTFTPNLHLQQPLGAIILPIASFPCIPPIGKEQEYSRKRVAGSKSNIDRATTMTSLTFSLSS